MKTREMMKEADKICRTDGTGCIFADFNMKSGSEVIIGGGMIYIIKLLSDVALRVAEKSESTFDDVLDAMKTMKSGKKATDVQGGAIIGAADPEAIIRADIAAEFEKRYSHRLKASDDMLQRQTLEIAAANATIMRLKEQIEANRDHYNQEKQQDQREIKKKEAEIRKLREKMEEYQIET